MKKSAALRPTDDVTTFGQAFGTPIVAKGHTWLPLTQRFAWPIMAWVAGRKRPDRPWVQRLGIGALTTAVVLGTEWCHNLAHAAAARLVGEPLDAMRVAYASFGAWGGFAAPGPKRSGLARILVGQPPNAANA